MKKTSLILESFLIALLLVALFLPSVNSVNDVGTSISQLTSNDANDWDPSISGDGSKIAFESNVDGDYEIFVVNSDGTELTQLTNNNATDWHPSISSDGS